MTMLVPLHLTPGSSAVYLRAICGNDEIAIEATDTGHVLAFLDGIILHNETGNRISPDSIVIADRDRLIAELHLLLYGAQIESTINCPACSEKIDLRFSLADLLGHYPLATAGGSTDGYYQADKGVRFRLPTGEDEMIVRGLDPHAAGELLFQRCCSGSSSGLEREEVETKMAEIAPLLDLEIKSVCPQCGSEQQVRFDMQSFFFNRLRNERQLLLHEIHSIAATYHWTLGDILSLPRNRRKQFASLIAASN